MEDLWVTLIQTDIYWHEIEANLAGLEEKIWQIRESPHLIVLPEMFNTGFTMDARTFAEPLNGKTFKWMKQMAGQTKAVVTGSYIVRERGHYYNRLIWMEPDGTFLKYDKRHLFRMADEDQYFTPGHELLITELNGWKICPLICYDLRFPVWSRNVYLKDQKRMTYDLAVYVANWPATRIQAWDILLQARAMENICYSLGVNRVGKDGKGIQYNGHTSIFDPLGRQVIYLKEDQEIRTHRLSSESLRNFREKFPVYLDSDRFTIN